MPPTSETHPKHRDQAAQDLIADNLLLQSRVDALGSILALQEEVMVAGRTDLVAVATNPHIVNNAGAQNLHLHQDSGHPRVPLPPAPASPPELVSLTLLRKWREKVFALLVQDRSQQRAHNASIAQLRREIAELTTTLQSKEIECTILRSSCLDKESENRRLAAQLDVSGNAIAAERALRTQAEERQTTAEKSISALCAVIPRAEAELLQKCGECNKALGRLDVLSRRLAFAVERAKTCKYLLSTHSSGGGSGESLGGTVTTGDGDDPDDDAHVVSALENELERLRRERDRLIETGAEHERTFAARVDEARERFADRLVAAETAVAHEQAAAAAATEACQAAEARLAEAAAAAAVERQAVEEDKERRIAAVQSELGQCRAERDAAVAELERTVIEKAADAAKHRAVVVELEHELGRAREMVAAEHRAERAEWERQVAQLGDQLERLSADRNSVAAGLEQANFRLWSRAHDGGAAAVRPVRPPQSAQLSENQPRVPSAGGMGVEDSPRVAAPVPAASVHSPRRSADPSDDGQSEIDTETTVAALHALSQNLLRSSASVT